MARKPVLSRTRVRQCVSVLSVVILTLTGSALAGVSQDDAKSSEPSAKSTPSQVSQVPVPPGLKLRKGGVLEFGSPVAFIDEAEPNDTTATAQALATTPVRVRAKTSGHRSQRASTWTSTPSRPPRGTASMPRP